MGFRNSISTVTVSGPVQLAAGGVVGLSAGSQVGVSSPSALIHPGLDDLLASAAPAATTWDSGAVALADSYEAISVVVTYANNGPGQSDCHLKQSTGAGVAYPVQLQRGGGGPFEEFVFPMDNQVGDTIDVKLGYLGALAQNITNVWVYGRRASAVVTRYDGLPVPKNAYSVSLQVVAAGVQNIWTAPGGGPPSSNLRVMLTRADLEVEPPASGVIRGQISATVKGAATTLVWCFSSASVPARKTVSWPNGLLVDFGTNITVTLAGTPGQIDAVIDFDLVAGQQN